MSIWSRYFSRKYCRLSIYSGNSSGKHAHIGYVAGTVLPRGMVGETKYLETAFDSAENIFFIASDGMHATCGMSVIVCFHCCVIISSIRMSNGSAGTSSII